jgi:hypothetical protein
MVIFLLLDMMSSVSDEFGQPRLALKGHEQLDGHGFPEA